MTDTGQGRFSTPLRVPTDSLPRFESPLVPRNSISGRALVAVVAIMTFLASLTTGATVLVSRAAGEWQSDISREVTIQVSPAPGRDLDATVDKAVAAARDYPGIAEVQPFSKEESTKLLEPWLG
ncbi:MAG: ABC transporter permease, partial [Pseudolabrys sp.]